MNNVRKLAFIAATVSVCLTSPAFAQSYVPSWGTGNVLPFKYGPGGTRLGPEKLYTIRRSGIYAYGAVSPNAERPHGGHRKAVETFSPRS